jgi:hypothetical protein
MAELNEIVQYYMINHIQVFQGTYQGVKSLAVTYTDSQGISTILSGIKNAFASI